MVSKRFFQVEDRRDADKTEYRLHDFFMTGFAMMYFQDPSLLTFQRRLQKGCNSNNLKTMFNIESIPKDTQLRDILDQAPMDKLALIFSDYLHQVQRNKYLEHYQFLDGRYLIPIDGSQYFSSKKLCCPGCLTKKSKGKIRYHHQILQAVIVHPDMKQVLPLAPESIQNKDGLTKQDCEINAGKRYVYEWINQVPLNGSETADEINFFQFKIINKAGKVTYKNSWVTDIPITKSNIRDLVKGGRARWKIENETFNTLKNQGYHIEHNFGHGKKNLSMTFFMLNLLAFYSHQILELTDLLYQRCRQDFSSRKEFWNQIRCTFRFMVFKNWETMIEQIIGPPDFMPP